MAKTRKVVLAASYLKTKYRKYTQEMSKYIEAFGIQSAWDSDFLIPDWDINMEEHPYHYDGDDFVQEVIIKVILAKITYIEKFSTPDDITSAFIEKAKKYFLRNKEYLENYHDIKETLKQFKTYSMRKLLDVIYNWYDSEELSATEISCF